MGLALPSLPFDSVRTALKYVWRPVCARVLSFGRAARPATFPQSFVSNSVPQVGTVCLVGPDRFGRVVSTGGVGFTTCRLHCKEVFPQQARFLGDRTLFRSVSASEPWLPLPLICSFKLWGRARKLPQIVRPKCPDDLVLEAIATIYEHSHLDPLQCIVSVPN